MRLRGAVRRANDAAVASVVEGGSPLLAVRRELPGLQTALHHETIVARQAARHAGRERLGVELGRELPSAVEGWAADDAAALAASGALSSSWGSSALGLISTTSSAATNARSMATLPGVIDGRVRRTAATEVAYAFNDERDEALVHFANEIFGPPDGPREPVRPAPGMFKVWSAVLDGRTCERCFAADGDIVALHESLKAGAPPLHPWCRCLVEHVIVGKTERLEDIGIDYAALKAEIRDVIREGRVISERHAVGFVSDSLGSKRSAEVLTRRFREERYATSGPTAAGGRVRLVPPAAPPAPPAPPPSGPPRFPGGGEGGGGGGRKPLSFVPHFTKEMVEELGATASGDIEAATKSLFAGRCPDVTSWARLWSPPAGYTIEFHSFRAAYGELTVKGALRTAAGDHVADMTRSFARSGKELQVSHDYLALGTAHQGKGIGEALTRNALLGYRDMNVERVHVDAHWAGRYTWARFGFSWPAAEAESYRKKLELFLTAELPGRDPAEVKVLAMHALRGAHSVAELEVDGDRLGKRFLLNDRHVPHWAGELRLVDGDVGYEQAKKRLKL